MKKNQWKEIREDCSLLLEGREKEVIGVGQRMSWRRRRVIERTLSFEVQPLLPFLLPGHALVAIFSSATTWSRSGLFCF